MSIGTKRKNNKGKNKNGDTLFGIFLHHISFYSYFLREMSVAGIRKCRMSRIFHVIEHYSHGNWNKEKKLQREK